MKQSSPVIRWHSTTSGVRWARSATFGSWRGAGRILITALSERPSAAGSTSARYPRITPACSSRCRRSATAGEESPTRRPSSASDRRASACSSASRRRFVESIDEPSVLEPFRACIHSHSAIIACIKPVRKPYGRSSCRCDRRGRQQGAAAPVLRRQRRVPLPRPGVRGAAVRAGGRARRGLAAHRLRRAHLRPVAAAVAGAGAARRRGAPPAPRLGRRAGADELLLLPGHRPAAAGHRCRHRVPARDRARGARAPAPRATSARSRSPWRACTCSPTCAWRASRSGSPSPSRTPCSSRSTSCSPTGWRGTGR